MNSNPNQDLSLYFEISTADLFVGKSIAFGLFVYLPTNQKMISWKVRGETLSADLLERVTARGLTRLWILNSEHAEWEKYRILNADSASSTISNAPAVAPVPPRAVGPPAPTAATPPPSAAPTTQHPAPAEPPIPQTPPQTQEGARIRAALADPALSDKARAEEVAREAQEVLAAVAKAADLRDQTKAEQHTRKILQDVLAATLGKANNLAGDLWKAAQIDAEIDHGINVATYGALFAMAFGRIDILLLGDIALAGMLHDIGLTQLEPSIASQTLSTAQKANPREEAQSSYKEHVSSSLRLLELFGDHVPERVKTLIEQHHEKFDGSGYPKKLQGFRFNDIAQLLSLADVMDSFVSGRWDGVRRTMKEALHTLEKLEKTRTFPEFFNPEVFSAVLKWTRATVEDEKPDSAAQIAADQTKKLGMAKAS